MSINSKMTAIADEIRTLSGTTETMGLDAMATNIGDANGEVSTQTDLLAQIASALEGKAAGGGIASGGLQPITYTFTDSDIVIEKNYEPGVDLWTFNNINDLRESTRYMIKFTASYYYKVPAGNPNVGEVTNIVCEYLAYRMSLTDNFTEYMPNDGRFPIGMVRRQETSISFVTSGWDSSLSEDGTTKYTWVVA